MVTMPPAATVSCCCDDAGNNAVRGTGAEMVWPAVFFAAMAFVFDFDAGKAPTVTKLTMTAAMTIRFMTTSLEMNRHRSGHRQLCHRSEEHTSELQSPDHLVSRLLL